MAMREPDLAKLIDHTLLKPTATVHDIQRLCQEALQYTFAAVCILPIYIPLCHQILAGSSVKVCTVIGFPLGGDTMESKAFATRNAIRHGAREVDMVMNLGAFKSRDYQLVERDIRGVVDATRKAGVTSQVMTKVILETCYLSSQEMEQACLLAKRAGADFVKTSTGFGPYGALAEDVRRLRKTVGREIGVKASGGIKSFEAAVQMLDAGANRLGTSSSVSIVKQ